MKIDSSLKRENRIKHSICINVFLLFISTGGAVSLTEIVLQYFPPTGTYASGHQFDQDLGYGFRPYSTVVYNKRNGLVRNTTNRDGWVDVDHVERKMPRLLRVGFFGDSYIEVLKVPSN